jgi:DNA-binding beta-propeller fold protein YncE
MLPSLNATVAASVVALLAGCSGTSLTNAPSASLVPMKARTFDAKSALKTLAVSDLGGGTILSRVELLNNQYELVGTITDGIDGATGDWYDAHGNLYVGNYAVPMVQEYAKGSTSPTFTYSSELERPYSVATDPDGNVYVADFYNSSGSSGGVVEYPQRSNTVTTQCSNSLNDTGVAVDKDGNVFVSSTSGTLLEYKHGLSGCKPSTLGVTLPGGGGLLVDKKRNLVACAGHVVDIIPPPYTSIALTISGFQYAEHDALTRDESLLFVADVENYDVQVFTYPDGSYVTTLDQSNGLVDPAGVAAYPAGK